MKVTKLNGPVSKDSLLKMGEMVVSFDIASVVSDDFLAIKVSNTKPFAATVKNGTFMNAGYSASEGSEKTLAANTEYILRVSNTGAELHLTEKYTLGLSYVNMSWNHGGIHFSFDDLCFALNGNRGLNLRGFENMTGHLNKLKGAYTYLDLANCFALGGTINGDFTCSNDFNSNSSNIGGVFTDSFIDKSKTVIQQVNITNAAITDDIANFPQCSVLTKLQLNNCSNVTGDISNFPHIDSLASLSLAGTGVQGTLANLYAGNALTELLISEAPRITGSLEDFAQACVGRGRTSGSIKVTLKNSPVTYNGAAATNTNWYWTITFSGSGYTITSGHN